MSNKTFQQPTTSNKNPLLFFINSTFFLYHRCCKQGIGSVTKSTPTASAEKKKKFKLLKFPLNKFPSLLSFSFQRNIQSHNLHNAANVM